MVEKTNPTRRDLARALLDVATTLGVLYSRMTGQDPTALTGVLYIATKHMYTQLDETPLLDEEVLLAYEVLESFLVDSPEDERASSLLSKSEEEMDKLREELLEPEPKIITDF